VNQTNSAPVPDSNAYFVTTHWSVVLSAQAKNSPQAGTALETLCRTYWYPLYAYVRRQGRSPHDAQDLTQEFFARLLEKDYLQAVVREKGKFRSFLLMAFKRFLITEWKQAHAQKRGGQYVTLSLETQTAETRYAGEPTGPLDAEKLYERRWALTLLDKVLERLQQEFVKAGKAALFDQLKNYLMAERGDIPYAQAATALNMNEGAVKVAVHRLRRRFRELFREEVSHTVSSPEEVDEEIRYLLAAFS
jgi:RNA polymerase sigma-70 factor (ECF subfamily)